MTKGGNKQMAQETKTKTTKKKADTLDKNSKMAVVKNLIEKGKRINGNRSYW